MTPPLFTMTVAVRPREGTGATKESALDLLVDDIRGYPYIVLRTGGVCVLLNEYETRALSVALDGLSPQATGLGSARDGAGRGSPDAPGGR